MGSGFSPNVLAIGTINPPGLYDSWEVQMFQMDKLFRTLVPCTGIMVLVV